MSVHAVKEAVEEAVEGCKRGCRRTQHTAQYTVQQSPFQRRRRQQCSTRGHGVATAGAPASPQVCSAATRGAQRKYVCLKKQGRKEGGIELY